MDFKCIVCNGRKSELISPKTRDSRQKIVKCSNCQLLQILPLPNEIEEKNFYDKDKQTKLIFKKISIKNLEKRTEADTQRRVEKIKKILSAGARILDVGCDYGFLVRDLNKNNYHCTGLEISIERRRIAKKVTKTNISSQKITGANQSPIRYDAITLFHVLEHITNPIQLCQNIKTYLGPKGVLIIEVPNIKDYMLISSRPYFDFFWQKAHVSYFSPMTVHKVLKKAGYKKIKIIGVQRYSFENAINWLKVGKPQLDLPTYHTTKELDWLENYYKNYLEQKLICDTLWVEANV